MPDKHLFEYAVLRVVPLVEREEFVNVGVILYCPGQRFLKMEFVLNPLRLQAFAPELDLDGIQAYLLAMGKVCKGGKEGGVIGQLTIASRFRWLTATRSSVIQTSKVHPGFCIDAESTIQKLMEQLVY